MVDLRAVNRGPHRPEVAPASPRVQVPTDDEHDDADLSEQDTPPATRAPRNSKPRVDAKPNQLQFYRDLNHGCWVDILVRAKNHYRLTMHTEAIDPFPARSTNSLNIAHDSLLETVGKLREGEWKNLDQCSSFFIYLLIITDNVIDVYQDYRSGMSALVSN